MRHGLAVKLGACIWSKMDGRFASVGFTRYPSVAQFSVFAFHRRPGDAVSGALACRAARDVFRPGVVEGTQVNLLRVGRQMGLNRWRKVLDGHVRQATSLCVGASLRCLNHGCRSELIQSKPL